MMNSSTLISSMPMLMPASSGIECSGYGFARRLANAIREFANVLTRMPNQATPTLPPMPTRLKSRMMPTRAAAASAQAVGAGIDTATMIDPDEQPEDAG